MSLIEEALVSKVTNDAGVSALIANRFYPVKLPQKVTLPAMTCRRISGSRVHSLNGSSGLASPRFQFSAWAKKYTEAKDIAEKLRLAIQGFRGTVLGVRIDAILFESDQDFYEDDLEIHQVASDYIIWHAEPKP